MNTKKISFTLTIVCCLSIATAHGGWLEYAPVNEKAVGGIWPAGSALTGSVAITADNFTNGIPATTSVGLNSITIGSLSPDFFSQFGGKPALTANPGGTANPTGVVPVVSSNYNDTGDKYDVKIDFTRTNGPNSTGVLPRGSLVAVVDMDLFEDFKDITATDATGNAIAAWLTPIVDGYFDMTTVPQLLTRLAIAPTIPTVTSTGGMYDMLGYKSVIINPTSGMLLFETAEDVQTISYKYENSNQPIILGTGGAGLGFYFPTVPEPTSVSLAMLGLVSLASTRRRRLRRTFLA